MCTASMILGKKVSVRISLSIPCSFTKKKLCNLRFEVTYYMSDCTVLYSKEHQMKKKNIIFLLI